MRIIVTLVAVLLLVSSSYASVEHLRDIEQTYEIVIDGSVYSETSKVGEVIRATTTIEPKTTYIRMQMNSGDSWKWSGPLEEYSVDTTSVVPDEEARWVRG